MSARRSASDGSDNAPAPLALAERLARAAKSSPDAVAIVEDNGARTTRAELASRIRSAALGFVSEGMRPGDRVLFAVRPGATAIVLMAAIVEAGGVIVPAAIGIGDALFAEQMRLVQPQWVVMESLLIAAGFSAPLRRLARTRKAVLPSLEGVRSARFVRAGRAVPWGPRTISVRALERRGAGAHAIELPGEDADRDAIIVFTSGTTAAPKGVVHSRRSLGATLDIIGAQLAMRDTDVLYTRDSHLALPALLAGARVVMTRDTQFDPARAHALLTAHGVTHMFAVTAELQTLVDWLVDRELTLPATLRRVLVGAAPVHASFLQRLSEVLPDGCEAWCVYGMSEMLPVAAIELAEKVAWRGDGDIVGALVPSAVARIADDGELVLTGDNLFTGYLGMEPVREHHTGDMAAIEDGRIVLRGRLKDMIIRGDTNIYPALHEPIIERIPGVRACAMVGVFDEKIADEHVALFVEPEDDACLVWGREKKRLIERLLGGLRHGPTRIDDAAQPGMLFVETLPRSGRSSKIDREALRERVRVRLREQAEERAARRGAKRAERLAATREQEGG